MKYHKNWIVAGFLLLFSTIDLAIDLLPILLAYIESPDMLIIIIRALLLFYVLINIKTVINSIKGFEANI
jgi:hypothetical protein